MKITAVLPTVELVTINGVKQATDKKIVGLKVIGTADTDRTKLDPSTDGELISMLLGIATEDNQPLYDPAEDGVLEKVSSTQFQKGAKDWSHIFLPERPRVEHEVEGF